LASTPYPISGYLYNITGTVAVAAGTVSARNASTGDLIKATTSSVGYYVIDLANGAKGYSDGDTIVITATDGTYIANWRTTVNVSDGFESLNLILLNDNFTDIARKGRAECGTYFNNYYNINQTVKTTTTLLVPPMQSIFGKHSSVTIRNRSTSTLTSKVWVTNKPQPGTVGGNDWIQLGSNITDSDVKEWSGVYLWTAVTATASTQTSQNVDCYFLATT
jgi:hypothetical protein